MDLQTRKLNLIQYLLNLQDENLFNKIESFIITKEKDLKTFTKDELVARAEKSNQDYLEGKFVSQDELETQSENW